MLCFTEPPPILRMDSSFNHLLENPKSLPSVLTRLCLQRRTLLVHATPWSASRGVTCESHMTQLLCLREPRQLSLLSHPTKRGRSARKRLCLPYPDPPSIPGHFILQGHHHAHPHPCRLLNSAFLGGPGDWMQILG